MSQNELFEYNGKFYVVNQLKYEPRELLLNRVSFILNNINKPTNTKSFVEIKRLSIIWSNMKYYECEYSQALTNQINEME